VVTDRLGGATAWSVTALLAIGLWTVHHWTSTEELGRGDLRWYGLYQGLTIVVVGLLVLLFPSRNGTTAAFVIAGAGNVAAKLFEFLDKRCTPDPHGVTLLDRLLGHPTKTDLGLCASTVAAAPAGRPPCRTVTGAR